MCTYKSHVSFRGSCKTGISVTKLSGFSWIQQDLRKYIGPLRVNFN